MALSIKNPQTERLARQVARRHGETITEAITRALQERLDRSRPDIAARREKRRRRLRTLVAEGRKAPVADTRPEDEILGYDEHGQFL